MDEKYSCPHCGQHLTIEDAPPGATIPCPNCRKSFDLPSEPSLKRRLTSPWIWATGLVLAVIVFGATRFSIVPRDRTASANKDLANSAGTKLDPMFEGRRLSDWVDEMDSDQPRQAREHARDILKKADAQIVASLIAMMQSPEVKHRRRGNAAMALGYAGKADGPEAQALIDALKDSVNYVRYSAIYTLRHLKVDSRQIVPLFIGLLADENSGVRRSAAVNLGSIGPPAQGALPALEKMSAGDEDAKTREAATEALKSIARPVSVKGPDVQGKSLAAWIADFASSDYPVRERARKMVRTAGKAVIPDLLVMQQDQKSDPKTRAAATLALGYAGSKDGPEVEILIQLLKEPNNVIRGNAISALGVIGLEPKTIIPLCLQMLTDPNNGVRRRAVAILGDLGPAARETLPAIEKAKQDPDNSVREAALKATSQINSPTQ